MISTDPAHSLSDALSQQLSDVAVAVDNVPGLYALEISPKMKGLDEIAGDNQFMKQISGLLGSNSLPGMDEIMSFTEVMRLAQDPVYQQVIFDTAPTGHTLRFLEIPQVAKGIFSLFDSMRGMIGGVTAMMG